MVGTAMAGDGFSSNVAGMSKNQLYDIMCQMKALVEQNQQQAKQILVQNPSLTRALFQAQIMLGMLQPPQLIPNIHPAELPPAESQPAPRPSSQTGHSLPPSMPVQVISPDASAYQTQVPFRKQQQNQPSNPVTSRIAPPINLQPPPMPSRGPHLAPPPRGNVQAAQPSHPQPSHFPDLPTPPLHSGSQAFSVHQPQISNPSLPTSGMQHLPTQPPLPQQPRPPSMPTFRHQLPLQMGPNMAFQHSGPPQMHHSQPMFHSGGIPPQTIGPPYSQGQSTPLNQPPPQSVYPTVGSHMARDFNPSAGNSMHIERELPWMPGPPETTSRLPPPPPPPSVPSQMAPGNQLPRPPPLSAEMERSLVQQVMSLTPEQINHLPPEQRKQVFQLQQMLR